MGTPVVIERLASLGIESWTYGNATVTFDPGSGRVIEWNDPRRELRVRLSGASRGHTATSIRLGDSRDIVIARLGTPWSYGRTSDRAHEILAYARSVIRLDAATRTVDGWIARDSTLPVERSENDSAQRAMGVVPAAARSAQSRSENPTPAAPAVLRAQVDWRDADGDGVVADGERFTITLIVRNEGLGAAYEVRPTVLVESPSLGARLLETPAASDIAPGGSHRFTLSLAAASPLAASEMVIVVGVSERNGFDVAPPQRLRIPSRSTGAPHIVVHDIRVEDQSRDARIAPREVADITVTLSNVGDAPTPPLTGRLIHGRDLFLAAGAPETFALGSIRERASADVSFALYTNSRASDVSLLIEVSDAARKVVARLPIALPFTPGGAALTVDIPQSASRTPDDRRVPRAPQIDDVERDIPRAAALRQDAIAVIIGVERYRTLPSARYATRDAELVRRYAVRALGVPDDDEHVIVRTDADASGNELRRLFGENGWLARHTTENTELFVYFAGHGAPDASGRTPFLLPFDADGAFISETGLSLGAIYDRLARLPAKSITVALDACFSGTTRDHRALVPGMRQSVLSIEHPALLRRNMAVFAAARDAESAGDLPDARHGAFTWYLARGLRGEADSDLDGAITVAELAQFVERGVARAAAQLDREQHPLTIARDSLRVVTRLRSR